MDEDLQTLETELKRLRPVPPPTRLEGRIAAQLDPLPRRKLAGVDWLLAGILPAAAAVAVLLAWPRTPRPPRPVSPTNRPTSAALPAGAAEPTFKPIAVENVLYDARDEGVVTLEDGTTAVRQRLNYVDTITWRNPRTNASVRWTVPREEVRFVPVSFQ